MASPLFAPASLLAALPTIRLLDARPGDASYAAGHLAGAVHADLNRTLSSALAPGADPANGGRHPLPPPDVFAARLGAWGITPDTTVVVYDDQGGANAAARAWWMLRSLGHTKVFVLDGGLAAARAAGVPMSTDVPAIAPAPDYPQNGWQLPTTAIADVEARAQDADWKVLDVRSGERYRGETESLDPVAGHIPGAKNIFYGENLDADGRFKAPDELRALYTEFLAGTPTSHLVVHCGSGVTACHTLLALEAAGLPGASLYVGSWSEWCRSGKPQAKGA